MNRHSSFSGEGYNVKLLAICWILYQNLLTKYLLISLSILLSTNFGNYPANEELINLKDENAQVLNRLYAQYGGSDLRIKWIGQVALLLLMLFAAPQCVLADSGQNSSENITSAPVNNTSTPTPAVEFVGVQGIWKASLADTEITMELNQSGDTISGRCKFIGAEPWNGVLTGSLSGKMATIAVAAMQGEVLVSTEMTGIISDDTIRGDYTSYDSNGGAAQDTFTATKISSDTSGYAPAQIATPSPSGSAASAEQPQTAQDNTTTIGQQSKTPTTIWQTFQAPKRKVTDVTQLAKGIDPNIMPRHTQL